MKKHLPLLLALSFLLLSCNKNAYDFSRMDGFEAEGNWGIPLVNANYSIEDILNMSNALDNIQTGEDNVLKLSYSMQKDTIIESEIILNCMENEHIEYNGSWNINTAGIAVMPNIPISVFHDTVEVALPSNKVIVENAIVKSGQLHIHFECDLPIQIGIKCLEVLNNQNESFSLNSDCGNGQINENIDLSGFRISPQSGNKLRIVLNASVQSDLQIPDITHLATDIHVNSLSFSELSGRIASFSSSFEETTPMDLSFLSHINGSLTLFQPQMKVEVNNELAVAGQITLDQAGLSHNGTVVSPFFQQMPITLDIPSSTQGYQTVELPAMRPIQVNTSFDNMYFKGSARINPNGMQGPSISIREGEKIGCRISFEIPFHIQLDNLSFKDTLALNGIDIPAIEGARNMVLKMLIESKLPINMKMQMYFYNQQTHEIVDSLFSVSQWLRGSFDGSPVLSEFYIEKADMDAVRKMLACESIIIDALADTEDKNVTIRSTQGLRVRLSAKFDLNIGELAGSL